MVEILQYSEYSLAVAGPDDGMILHMMLKDAVIQEGSVNSRARQDRVLCGYIRRAVNMNNNIIVLKNNKPVGAAIFDDRRINEIIHINILKEYRLQLATIVLLDYLLSTAFNSQDVYFHSEDPEIQRFGTNVKDNTYKVLNTIAPLFRHKMEK